MICGKSSKDEDAVLDVGNSVPYTLEKNRMNCDKVDSDNFWAVVEFQNEDVFWKRLEVRSTDFLPLHAVMSAEHSGVCRDDGEWKISGST